MAGVTFQVWTNKQTETITFPHPSDAGGKNTLLSYPWNPLTNEHFCSIHRYITKAGNVCDRVSV